VGKLIIVWHQNDNKWKKTTRERYYVGKEQNCGKGMTKKGSACVAAADSNGG
jgi:hypothetical protein